MKKNLFIAAIAAMCFTSCSHEEPVATLTATVNAPDSMHTKAVCFAVSGDFHVSTAPMTRAMTADGVVGQAQIVVGAEIQHLCAVLQGDAGFLRGGNDPLGFFETVVADLLEGGLKVAQVGVVHLLLRLFNVG